MRTRRLGVETTRHPPFKPTPRRLLLHSPPYPSRRDPSPTPRHQTQNPNNRRPPPFSTLPVHSHRRDLAVENPYSFLNTIPLPEPVHPTPHSSISIVSSPLLRLVLSRRDPRHIPRDPRQQGCRDRKRQGAMFNERRSKHHHERRQRALRAQQQQQARTPSPESPPESESPHESSDPPYSGTPSHSHSVSSSSHHSVAGTQDEIVDSDGSPHASSEYTARADDYPPPHFVMALGACSTSLTS